MNRKLLLLAVATLLPVAAHAAPAATQAPLVQAYSGAYLGDSPSIFLARRDMRPRQEGQLCAEPAAFVITGQLGSPMISLVRRDLSPRPEPKSYICPAPSAD